MLLPERIQKDRENELAKKLKNGAITQEEQIEFIKGYIRLAASLSKGNISDAFFGLIFAVEQMKNKEIENATAYIRTTISHFICLKSKFRKEKTNTEEILFNREKKHPFEIYELTEILAKVIRTKFEKEIIRLRQEGWKDPEIADKLHITRSYVYKLRKAIRARFERELSKNV